MKRKYVPPEWPDRDKWNCWAKFDGRARPQNQRVREDGAYGPFMFIRHYKKGYPQLRIEDGWYWPFDENGEAMCGDLPNIEWIEVEAE